MIKQHFSVMSSHQCKHPGCERYIKQNLVDRKARIPDKCFRHFIVPPGVRNRKAIMNGRAVNPHAKVSASRVRS